MDKVSVDVVIPCYNEEETLPALFYKLEKVEDIIDQDGKYKINFIFVNDGSTDKTLEILKQEFNKRENVNILALEKNSGFGAA
ncbi:MAG: glycosyltransferase, partial [bacterium]|nr:glycosyltransferase [bacterium]